MGCCGTEVWLWIVYSSETDGFLPSGGRTEQLARVLTRLRMTEERAMTVLKLR